MADPDLGEAAIVYEDPEEGTVERTVQNERVAYFQDHWIVKLDEDEAGNDLVRRVPLQRVHYVERSVEEFESEVSTLRNQVEAVARDIGSTLFGDDAGDADAEPRTIEVDSESDDDSRADGRAHDRAVHAVIPWHGPRQPSRSTPCRSASGRRALAAPSSPRSSTGHSMKPASSAGRPRKSTHSTRPSATTASMSRSPSRGQSSGRRPSRSRRRCRKTASHRARRPAFRSFQGDHDRRTESHRRRH